MAGFTPEEARRFLPLFSSLMEWWQQFPAEAELTLTPMGEYLEVSLQLYKQFRRKSLVTILRWGDGLLYCGDKQVSVNEIEKKVVEAMLKPDFLPQLEVDSNCRLWLTLQEALQAIETKKA